jgi:hypothetical protein
VGAHPRPAQEAPRAAPLTSASSRVNDAIVLPGKAEGAAQKERLLRDSRQQTRLPRRSPPPHRPTLSALAGRLLLLLGNAAQLCLRWESAAHYRADRTGGCRSETVRASPAVHGGCLLWKVEEEEEVV